MRTAVDPEALTRDYLAGIPMRDLVGQYGYSDTHLRSLLRARGVSLRAPGGRRYVVRVPRRTKVTLLLPATIRRIVAAYRGGKGLRAVGKMVGMSAKTIRKVLAREGVATRRVGHPSAVVRVWTPDVKAMAVARVRSGESTRRVARELRLHRDTLRRWLAPPERDGVIAEIGPRRRCECGGIIAEGVEHRCRYTA